MASFPLYETFFYCFTQKSSLFVQLFRKNWEKNWASTKKLFDTPLNSGGCQIMGGVGAEGRQHAMQRYATAFICQNCMLFVNLLQNFALISLAEF